MRRDATSPQNAKIHPPSLTPGPSPPRAGAKRSQNSSQATGKTPSPRRCTKLHENARSQPIANSHPPNSTPPALLPFGRFLLPFALCPLPSLTAPSRSGSFARLGVFTPQDFKVESQRLGIAGRLGFANRSIERVAHALAQPSPFAEAGYGL